MKGTTVKAETWQEAMEEFDHAEKAQRGRDKSNGLLYSLDDEEVRDYLESQCTVCHYNPSSILIEKEAHHVLHEAMSSLSATQKHRIYLHFWERKCFSEIAGLEGVDESAVRRSIERGLYQLRKKLIGTSVSANDFARHSPTRYVKHYHPKKESEDMQNKNASLINIYEGGEQNEE